MLVKGATDVTCLLMLPLLFRTIVLGLFVGKWKYICIFDHFSKVKMEQVLEILPCERHGQWTLIVSFYTAYSIPWVLMTWRCKEAGHQQPWSLRWRHNGCDSVSNHQPHDCLLNRLFGRRSKKTGLCAGNSPGTGELPAQMASNGENVSIWWRHHEWPSSRSFQPL